jgi:hypothetical protein
MPSVRHHLRSAFRRQLGKDSPETELLTEVEREPWYKKAPPGQKRTVRAVLMEAVRDAYQRDGRR